jgi:hypothetical protein
MTAPASGAASASGYQDHALLDVLERLRNRFFGKYRGIVADTDAKTMRIKANVPAVLGDVPTGWARACVPFAGPKAGFAFLPAVGSGVWIEFEGGDVSLPIWVGCYWHDGDQPSDATTSVLALVTGNNLKVLLDLDGGSITVEAPNNSVVVNGDGVTLSGGGQSVALASSGVNINNGALEVTT